MDPFDDVRHTSTTILKILLAKMLSVTSGLRDNGPCGSESYGNGFALSGAFNIHLEHVLLRAEAMMQHTGRADYADGVGRLYEILFESCSSLIDPIFWYKGRRTILERLLSDLEEEINVAKENLLLAVSTAPLHGHLIALRHESCTWRVLKHIPLTLAAQIHCQSARLLPIVCRHRQRRIVQMERAP